MEIMLKPWANPLNDADVNLAIADGEITRLCSVETKLRADIAAAQSEAEGRRQDLADFARITSKTVDDLKAELAAHQLVIKQLRDAIITVYGCYPPPYGTGEKCVVAREALALQATQEALDAYVDSLIEKLRVAEEALEYWLQFESWHLPQSAIDTTRAAINRIKGVG